MWTIALLVACLPCAAQFHCDVSLRNLPTNYTIKSQPETDSTCLAVVRDAWGRTVKDLTKEHFSIRHNGDTAQIVRVAELEQLDNVELRVVFVIDNSKSMVPRLQRVLADMDTILAHLHENASISVVSFHVQPIILNGQTLNVRTTPFLRNKNKIREIYTNIMKNHMTHSTYLYDAVYAASSILKEKPTMVQGREVKTYVILFSDGKDIGSEVSSEESLNQVYTGGNAPVFYTIDYFRQSNAFLKSLAAKTKGQYYTAQDSYNFTGLLANLARDTYSMGYRISFQWHIPPTIVVTDIPKKLAVSKNTVNEAFPLLSYIFFDEKSAAIPRQYHMLTQRETRDFTTATLPPDAMTYYYHTLNIIGYRMTTLPDATLTLTGCNADTGAEKNDTALARQRAETIAAYFTNVWNIAPERLRIEARNLPALPSRSTDEEAHSENRRVEITSDTWDIIKPIVFRKTSYELNNDTTTALLRALIDSSPYEARSCVWTLQHGDTVLWKTDALNGTISETQLPWSTVLSTYTPTSGDTLVMKVQAVSTLGDTTQQQHAIVTTVDADTGTIHSIRDKISLVLFDFNKADVNPYNTRIIREFVYPHVKSSSSVVVKGYTDNVGSAESNINLSEKRAISVGSIIRSALSVHQISMHGRGEFSPLFSNKTPEGRFYNRTVIIFIETPVE